MDRYNSIIEILPETILNKIRQIDMNILQELRIKVGLPLILETNVGEKVIDYICRYEDLKTITQRVSKYSMYAFEEDIRQGFITIKGGHRIGLTGEWVIEKEKVKTIRNISSLNIRVTKEILGAADSVIPYITSKNTVINTIIISPPKCGKTTLLRDITRTLSNGISSRGFKGKKISVIDERSEIGACFKGIPQMDLGIRTDVFDNCIKSEGMFMAIRSMSPEVIICDEIGTSKDVDALIKAFSSGVNIITSIHGYGIKDLYNREIFKDLLINRVIKRVVVLSNNKGPGTIEQIKELGEGRSWLKEFFF